MSYFVGQYSDDKKFAEMDEVRKRIVIRDMFGVGNLDDRFRREGEATEILRFVVDYMINTYRLKPDVSVILNVERSDTNKFKKKTTETVELVKKLYGLGMNKSEISRKLKISRTTVARIVDRL